MGLQDAVHYVLFSNPVSAGVSSYIWSTASAVPNYLGIQPKVEVRMAPPIPLWKLAAASGPYIRLAALSGAAAVTLGAYGAHKQYPQLEDRDLKAVFETASRYHFIHTLALLGLPLCRTPFLAAMFMVSGMFLFSGTCYYYAFTGDKQFSKLTPIGGVCLIMGWLSMCI